MEIYRRKLELQREARPRITVLRVIPGAIKVDKVTTRGKHVE